MRRVPQTIEEARELLEQHMTRIARGRDLAAIDELVDGADVSDDRATMDWLESEAERMRATLDRLSGGPQCDP